MEETIETLTDGKQDKIFNLKQGFLVLKKVKTQILEYALKKGSFT